MQPGEPKGWYRRRALPHLDAGGGIQFVTWRLADAVPQSAIRTWREELRRLPESRARREMQRRIEAFCDAGHGSCVLGNASAAIIVQQTLFGYQGRLIDLLAWCVMPNHVHVLMTPLPGFKLGEVVGKLKGASSREINSLLGRSGVLWQEDYFDRLMRDEDHMFKTRKYIEWNPVKAKLCSDPQHWAASSATPIHQEWLTAKVKV